METSMEIPVRSTEVDFLNHVNNAKFLEYMEWGRENWYSQTGYTFDRLAQLGIGTVIANININYYKECRIGDILIVKTGPVKTGKSSFVLLQRIDKKETGEKVSEAHVTTVLIDLNTRNAIPIPDYLRDYMEK